MKNLTYVLLFSVLTWGCADDSENLSIAAASDTGIAGSYARFIVAGDFMYIVDEVNLKTFSLANPAVPELVNEQPIGSSVETVYRLNNRLFIGSSNGLFLYTIGIDGLPIYAGEYDYANFSQDIEPCDPVVANDSIAYVTLNTTNRIERCRVNSLESLNLLNLFDITDFNNPVLLSQYEMVNPKGLGLDGSTLFVCDGIAGLKVFDVSDPYQVIQILEFPDQEVYDVIPLDGLLLVIGPENVYQYDYTDLENMVLISQISIGA